MAGHATGTMESSSATSSITASISSDSMIQETLVRMLIQERQHHLFEHWQPGKNDEDKRRFFNQIEKLNDNYPGGLVAYIHNARSLLRDSKAGRNPFDGYTPSVPTGEKLSFGDKEFMKFEEAGVQEASQAAFVLVAGGLGERLGYSGIKIALPSQTTTGISFLEGYIQSILALQAASRNTGKLIPLVIMTSDDTHRKTQELLEANKFFGMSPVQVHLLKQEKVACLADNDARIALDPSDPFLIQNWRGWFLIRTDDDSSMSISRVDDIQTQMSRKTNMDLTGFEVILQTKPHGHGDVHALLYASGLLTKWQEEGRKWVLFFQDTNGLLFKAVPSALGVSVIRDLDVNSLAVPRKAKEAIGGITQLTHKNGSQMVINVEYNQLDPLLRATGHPDGDVNDDTGYSPFPGNINQLVLKIGPYLEELSRTAGAIVEFVNPKYKDASKTQFKSSTRLECMMQDYPRTLPPTAKVGFTVLPAWLAYAPVKNNPDDAAKIPEGNPKHSPTSGELAIYKAHCLILCKAGAEIEDPKKEVFNGQAVEVWPRIVWNPSWAITFADVCKKLKTPVHISQRSTLVLEGNDISLDDLSLDGTFVLRAVPGAQARLSHLRVQNKGWGISRVDHKQQNFPEIIRIRGFHIEKHDQRVLIFDKGGPCCVDNVSL